MEIVNLKDRAKFSREDMQASLFFDSPDIRMLQFCFEPGQELPVHSHDVDSHVFIYVIEGERHFTGGEEEIPAKEGDILTARVAEKHGLKAKTKMRALVGISPPI